MLGIYLILIIVKKQFSNKKDYHLTVKAIMVVVYFNY